MAASSTPGGASVGKQSAAPKHRAMSQVARVHNDPHLLRFVAEAREHFRYQSVDPVPVHVSQTVPCPYAQWRKRIR